MKVRELDVNHDWLFGKGQNNYLSANKAVVQNIDTRLHAFLGDCFFDLGAGIDWFNLLGGKDQLALNLAISAVILNTQNVTGIIQLSTYLDVARRLTIRYQAQTTYSQISSSFELNLNGNG